MTVAIHSAFVLYRAVPAGSSFFSSRAATVALRGAGAASNVVAILARLPNRLVQTERRKVLRDGGRNRDELILVASGLFSSHKDDFVATQITALSYPGDLIIPPREGLAPRIQAILPSRAVIWSFADIAREMRAHSPLQEFIWNSVERRQAILEEWLANSGTKDATERVAHLLCELAVRSGIDPMNEPLHLALTQQQLGEIAGQTTVNVNRVLMELERSRLIVRSNRTIHFEDWDALRGLARFRIDYLA